MAKIQPVITPTATYIDPEAAIRGFNSANAGVNAFANPDMAQVGQAGQEAAAKVGGIVANNADDVVKSGSKLSKGLDMGNKFVAPIQAATSVVGLGFDIYNMTEAQKQAKEQMDLAKKNFNLELEKQQKYELANNRLAASIDKAWGGDGKVDNTIDYLQYKMDAGGGDSLVDGGAGQGEYMGANSNTPALSQLGGSGNIPTLTLGGAGGMPVGHSESIETDNNDHEQDRTETS